MNFQANIRKPDGSKLESPDVSFRFKYLNAANNCTVYIEDFNNQSMVGSGGNISLKMGSGSKVFPPAAVTLVETFSNTVTNIMPCSEGGNYSPILSTENRNVRIEFVYTGSGGLQTISGVEINSTPYSMYATESDNAKSLGGFAANLYAKFSDVTTCTGGDFLTYNGSVFSCATPGAATQWTSVGPDIHFSTGKVGIGTATPVGELDVQKNIDAETIIQVTNLSAGSNAYSRMSVLSDVSTGGLTAWSSTYAGNAYQRPASVSLATNAAATGGLALAARNAAGGIITFHSGGNNEVARFDIAGNLGIGNAAPAYKLDVAGDINVTGNFKINGVNISNTPSPWLMNVADTYFNTGNVGIGTNTPSTLLHISSATPTAVSTFTNQYGSYTAGAEGVNASINRFLIKPTTAMVPVFSIAQSDQATARGAYFEFFGRGAPDSADSESLRFILNDAFSVTGTQDAVIDTRSVGAGVARNIQINPSEVQTLFLGITGNVGIGTVAPAHKLDVAGDINVTGNFKVNGVNVPTPGSEWLKNGSNLYYSAGNVGIGINAPRSAFDVMGGIRAQKGVSGSDNGNVGYSFEADGDTGMFAAGGLNNSGSDLTFYSDNIELLRLSHAGNVGIGSNNPDSQLHLKDGTGLHVQATNAKVKLSDVTTGMAFRMDGLGNMQLVNNADSPLSTFLQSGRVGIGVVAPTESLQVDGLMKSSLAVDNSAARAFAFGMSTDAGNSANSFAPGDPQISLRDGVNSGTNTLQIFGDSARTLNVRLHDGTLLVPNGRIGVGTETPTDPLQVIGTGTFTSGLGNISFSPDYMGAGVIQSYQSAGVFRPLQLDGAGVKLSGKNAGIQLMDANVGINTVTPESLLHIKQDGDTYSDGLKFERSGANTQTHSIAVGTDNFLHFGYAATPAGVPVDSMVIATNGNVGIGTITPSEKLEVNGFIKAQGFKTGASALGAEPLFIRGSGNHNPVNRLVKLGNQTLVDDNTRGLTLTILTAATHAHVSSTNYDTYLNTTESDNLTIALNDLKRDQIGILTSFDAFQAFMTPNLRTAARRLGLFKLAMNVEFRAPYLAIFYGAGLGTANTEVNRHTVEILQSGNINSGQAYYSTWLMDGAFGGQNLTNALVSADPSAFDPAVVVDASGNVGMGTVTPNAPLQVYRAGTNDPIARFGSLGLNDSQILAVSNGSGSIAMGVAGNANAFIPGTTAGDTVIRNDPSKSFILGTPSTMNMMINGSGNVGIGIAPGANPVARMGIYGGVTDVGGELNLSVTSSNIATIPATISSAASAGTLQIFSGGLAVGSTRGGQIDFVAGAHASAPDRGSLLFRTGTGAGGTSQPERMRIAANGNVGIGTSSPFYPFEVARPSVANDTTEYIAGFTAGADGVLGPLELGISMHPSANGGDRYVSIGAGDSIAARPLILGMTANGSMGNVGIGITNPAYPLDVTGDININAANWLLFGGTPICNSGGCVSPSDLRLKENVKPLDNSLSKILRLQGVEYDYKDKAKFGDRHQVGVIAQEVEKVFPEVVVTNEKTGLKAVAYDHLVAPLIESVKSLYKRILSVEEKQSREVAAVQEKMQKLERENAELKSRLERIEKALQSK